jgi:hypothetical protein
MAMRRLAAVLVCLLSFVSVACSNGSPTAPSRLTELASPSVAERASATVSGAASMHEAVPSSTSPWPPEGSTTTNPPQVCDPMTPSDIAKEIAAIKAELQQVKALWKKLRNQLGLQIITDLPKWEAEQARTYAALEAWDANPVVAIVSMGPRQPYLDAWMMAVKMVAITLETIRNLEAQILNVELYIDELLSRLRQLEDDLFELCHDQPAPPAPPALPY